MAVSSTCHPSVFRGFSSYLGCVGNLKPKKQTSLVVFFSLPLEFMNERFKHFVKLTGFNIPLRWNFIQAVIYPLQQLLSIFFFFFCTFFVHRSSFFVLEFDLHLVFKVFNYYIYYCILSLVISSRSKI